MLLTILFGACMSLLTSNAYAQNANVSLSVKGASLEQVMEDIEKQTNYLLVYHENVDLQQTVSVDIKNASVTDALDKVCAGLPVEYKISGSNISLYPAAADEAQAKVVKGRITDTNGEPIIRFSADSDCTCQSMVYKNSIIITAPHHGSEANSNVYQCIKGNDIIWVRSDRKSRIRPCDTFKKLASKYCLACANRNAKSEISFRYNRMQKKWIHLSGMHCNC